MAEDPEERERRATQHAETVLERRNRAFRVLYNTFLQTVGLKGRSIYLELCRHLRDISDSGGVALAVHDAEAGTLTLEAYSCVHGVSLMPEPKPIAFSKAQAVKMAESNWTCPGRGESWLGRYFPDSHVVSHIVEESLSAYEVSCSQDGELVALALLLYPQGFHPKMKDMIDTYLHVAGMTIRREQANRRLVESERKYRTLIETTGTGYSLLTPTYQVIDANSAYLKMSGHSELSHVQGRCMTEWLTSESGEAFERACYSCDDQGFARNVELAFESSEGIQTPVEMNFTVNGSGEEQIVIGLCRDISSRKAMEADLHHMQRMEVVGRMAGGIAHDFNNILFSVMGFSQLALRKLETDSIQGKNIQEVVRAARRGKELVEQILIFSRWREKELFSIDIAEVLQDSLESLQLMVPENVEVLQNIEQEQLVVMGDTGRLRQAITNICSNALQAMALTGGVLTLGLSKEEFDKATWAESIRMKPGIYAKISISDSGAGILPEVKSRIFEPFFTTKGAGQGTGLGLAAVHGILEEHQGGIRVHSELGKGSTFELFVPLADDTIVVQVVQEKATCTGSGSVLVVDDERTLSSLVKQMLAELGYAVSAFMDPIEAFESYKADPSAYDLVIVDQSMPRMKGMEFAQQVWAINESAKVVMLTGFSEDITPEEAVRQGCFRCLVKPVEFDVLANCVAEAMLA